MNKSNLMIPISLFFLSYLYGCNNSSPKKTFVAPVEANEGTIAKYADSIYHRKNYKEALIMYNQLKAINSLDSSYYFRSGYCEAMLFFYKESIIDYKAALDHNYKKSSCYLNLAADYASIDSEEQFKFYAKKCVETDSTKARTIKEMFERNFGKERF